MGRRALIAVCVVLIAATALAETGKGTAEEKVLNLYNWAEYIGPTTQADFEAEYGIKVNFDSYDSTAVVDARLLAGNSGYDVVLQALRYSTRLMPIGVFQPLNRGLLPRWDNLDPWVLDRMEPYDPGHRYAVPYMWGTTGLAYNVGMVRERMPDAPLDSAALVFDPAIASRFADCGISFLDVATSVFPLVMLYLGHPAQSADPRHIAEAEAVLKSVRPFIRYFSSTRMTNDLPNGEVCIAMSWSGEYLVAQSRADEVGIDIDLAFMVPREGTVLFFDSLLIPADAPHPKNAHLFLDFLMRPEVIAEVSNFTGYANANRASLPFLDPYILNDPAAYPPLEDRAGWEGGRVYEPKIERRRTRAFSRVMTGLQR